MTFHAASTSVADLVRQQTRLLDALFAETDFSVHTAKLTRNLPLGSASESLAKRGLAVYRANAAALAERALSASYPVLAQLIGPESFAPLAQHFWLHAPPQLGDVAQWGAELAAFVDRAPQLAGEPFLGDVARVEWALHCAVTASDSSCDIGSFALLASGESAQATLTLSDGVFVLASVYPVVSIVTSHLHAEPSLAQVADLLGAGVSEHALVWRQGFKPRLRQCSAAEYAMLLALQAGLSLEAALDATSVYDGACGNSGCFDFNNWLTEAVQSGLVIGAHVVNTANNTEEETS